MRVAQKEVFVSNAYIYTLLELKGYGIHASVIIKRGTTLLCAQEQVSFGFVCKLRTILER